jgi:hypothetical protein
VSNLKLLINITKNSLTNQAKILILILVAVEKISPPASYFGSEVIRRLKSPPNFPDAEKIDVWGRRNATPREIEQIIFNGKGK